MKNHNLFGTYGLTNGITELTPQHAYQSPRKIRQIKTEKLVRFSF